MKRSLSLTFLVLAFFGCSHFQSEYNAKDLSQVELKPVWIQNTLTQKNEIFRKINRFSPLFDTRENLVIAANSIEGLLAYNLNYTGTAKDSGRVDRTVRWKLDIKYGVEAPGTMHRGLLYVGGLNGTFYAVKISDGTIVWEFPTSAEIVAEPVLHRDQVLFMNGANQVFALNAENGKQIWAYNRQDASSGMSIRGGSKPSISGSTIFFGFSDGSLVALNLATGTPLWEVQLNRNSRFKDIDSSAVVSGDYLYVNSYDDHLYSLNKQTGQIVWKSKVGGISSPLIVGDRLVFSASNSTVVGIDKSNGNVMWTYKDVKGIATDVLSYKGLVVFGESQGSLIALDLLSGTAKASFEPGRGIFSKPTLIEDDGSFIFTSNEGNLYQVQLVHPNKNSLTFLR